LVVKFGVLGESKFTKLNLKYIRTGAPT
jgi:hypothetical protein